MGKPNDPYFSDHEYLSNSMLKVFRRKPSLYEALFVTHTLEQSPPTDAMIIGSMTHTYVFEPEKFREDYHILGYADRRTKACKEEIALAQANGKTPVLSKDVMKAKQIADAVYAHEEAAKILGKNGEAEKVIRWEQDGIKRKAKLDWFVPINSKKCVIADLKTTIDSNADVWADQCWNLGYRHQVAWYIDAVRSLGYEDVTFVYIVADKQEEPYDVCTFTASEEEVMWGEVENAATLEKWRNFRESGIWKRPEQIGLNKNPLPSWR